MIKTVLNDQICSIAHEVDLPTSTHEGPLVGTDRNEYVHQFCCVNWFL